MTVSGYDFDGNPIFEEFEVVRFGVKNGKVQTLSAGNYTISEYKKMESGVMGFKINGPYYFHLLGRYNPNSNWGCLAIKGGQPMWDHFVATLSSAGWNSNMYDLASSRIINVNIQYAPTPIVKLKN